MLANAADHHNMTPRRWFSGLSIALLVGAVGIAPAVSAQIAMPQQPARGAVSMVRSASSSMEAEFLSRINSLRASKGLSQLQLSGELVGVARNWTDQMTAAGVISHNPNLAGQVGGAWTKLGENVGVTGPTDSISSLMQAFIESPGHYANLIRPEWTHVGVGVTTSADGRLVFTTHDFMALGTPAPAPAPARRTAPAPSTRPRATTAPVAAPPVTAPAPPVTAPPPPPAPHPTATRITAVLDPLRSIEHG